MLNRWAQESKQTGKYFNNFAKKKLSACVHII